MAFLLWTVLPSYVRRHPGKTILALVSIAIGVATFVSVKTAQRALGSSFAASVDRLAGHADLQITGLGGVPELQETLRAVVNVEAAQPIIEQVVQPEHGQLGGLLVVGVDLAGDQRMRDYGFDASDADVDDPLVFLAQQDSVAISRDFASRAGLGQDDTFGVRVGGAIRLLTVRALLPRQELTQAYGGNVAVMDIYAAQEIFGRGRRFDRIEVRLAQGTSVEEGIAAITRAIGPGYRVDTPERRGAELQRLADAIVNSFDVITVIALAVGLFLVFNVFTIAVERRRRDIGVLRAVGATAWHITAWFLCEAAVLGTVGGLAGAAIGTALAGRSLALMGATLQATTGMTGAASAVPNRLVMMQGLGVGLVASLVAAWLPARRAARLMPGEAIASGVAAITPEKASPWRALAGLGFVGAAYSIGRLEPMSWRYLLPMIMLAAAFGTILFAGRFGRALVGPALPLLTWLAPASGRVAADALRQPRRTLATSAVLTVSAAFVLGTAGYLEAVRASFDGWIANIATADLVVRASTGWGSSALRLPYDLGATLLEVPGVTSADGVRNDVIEYRGERVTLTAVESRVFVTRTRQTFLAGNDQAFTDSLPVGQCVVSEPFARRFAIRPGETVALESPTGMVPLRVAAVIAGDRRAITIDRSVFVTRWESDRVDGFYLILGPGADAGAVRETLRARIDAATPALISTRQEFVDEMRRAFRLVYAVFSGTVLVSLVVALLGIALSQAMVIADRTRDIGVLRAIGAVPMQIGGAVILEAMTLALVSLTIALPLGDLLAWVLRARGSERFAGFHFSRAYPFDTVWVLLIALPAVSVIATWVPARWAAGLNATETISYE